MSAIPPVDQPWYSWFSLLTPEIEMSGRCANRFVTAHVPAYGRPAEPMPGSDHDHAVDLVPLLGRPGGDRPAERETHDVGVLAQAATPMSTAWSA